jgi:signal transduction histidine kinase
MGLGLGFMIVQDIVDPHGGGLEVDGTSGQGSQFKVWLPLSVLLW